MRARVRLAALAAAGAAAATLAVILVAGRSHDSTSGFGALRWDRTPLLVADVGRTGDLVVIGRVRNASLRAKLQLRSDDVRVLDAHGRRVPSYARYINAYAHGLYGAYPRVPRLPAGERRRLGFDVTLQSGQTAPLFVAFRPGPGARRPLRIAYGPAGESLPVPGHGRRAPADARLGR